MRIGECVVDGCEGKKPILAHGYCGKHYHRWQRYGDTSVVILQKGLPLVERLFARRMVTETGCWEWTGTKSTNGYGILAVRDRKHGYERVHRLSAEIWIGATIAGMDVLHKCDNPPCFNPEHLYIGTHKENMRDRRDRDRSRTRDRVTQEVRNIRKLTPESVREIKLELRRGTVSQADLAKRFGVAAQTINGIAKGRSWSWLTV